MPRHASGVARNALGPPIRINAPESDVTPDRMERRTTRPAGSPLPVRSIAMFSARTWLVWAIFLSLRQLCQIVCCEAPRQSASRMTDDSFERRLQLFRWQEPGS